MSGAGSLIWDVESGVAPQAHFYNDFAARGITTVYYGYNAYGVLRVGDTATALGLLGHTGSGAKAPIREPEVTNPHYCIMANELNREAKTQVVSLSF